MHKTESKMGPRGREDDRGAQDCVQEAGSTIGVHKDGSKKPGVRQGCTSMGSIGVQEAGNTIWVRKSGSKMPGVQ